MSAPQRPAGPPPARPPPGAPPGAVAGAAGITPQRPPGPPPGRPVPADATVRGIGDIKRPPGPPPGQVPVTALKPPPIAPPPRNLVQTAFRPPVENIKAIVAPKSPTKAAQQTGPTQSTLTPVGSMPRMIAPRGVPMDLQPDLDEGVNKMIRGAAAPKFSDAARPAGGARKAGAISMFEQPEPPQEPAEKKQKTAPMAKPPRPAPPKIQPGGIPVGEPLPPESKPLNEDAKAPPPVRLPPDRGRAPPKEDPEGYRPPVPKAVPPQGEPPTLRKKKEKVEIIIPRRDRDHPEFESSSEEEDEDGNRRPKKSKSEGGGGGGGAGTAWKEAAAATACSSGAIQQGGTKPPLPSEPPPPVDETGKPMMIRPITADGPLKRKSIEIREQEAEKMLKEAMKNAEKVARRGSLKGAWDNEPASPEPAPAPQPSLPMNQEAVMSNDALPPPEATAVPPVTPKRTADDLRLARELPRGRISIKCNDGIDFRRKDDVSRNPRIDPYIRFRLGVAEKTPWNMTETKRKQTNNPNFGGEVVYFNVMEPADYVLAGDLQLVIEVYNKGSIKDELLGAVTMSVIRFFRSPFVTYSEKVPVYLPGQQFTKSKLSLEFVFEEARSGLAQITLFEARGLRNIDPMGQQNPYVQFQLGEGYSKRSRTVKNGGTKPYFSEESVLMWVNQDNWINDMKIDVYDDDMGQDKPIGSTHFSLLGYMNQTDAKEDVYDLFYMTKTDPKDASTLQEIAQGQLVMRVRFFQAGILTAKVDRAKNLKFPETHVVNSAGTGSRMDPYVRLTLDGKAIRTVKRTPADKDGGSSPVWAMDLSFDIVDQYQLEVEVFHQNIQGGQDILLGSTVISLLNIFRQGTITAWNTLKQRRANGGNIDQGDIQIEFTFLGPRGVAYPQLRPEVSSYDDTSRQASAIPPQIKEKGEEEPDVISTIPQDTPPKDDKEEEKKGKYESAADELLPAEFSDDEIVAAFKFIDLDHNNFIGAKEIRHILICMGELITDEEIDMMISMVDQDGDGQVSFLEFRTLVLHPHPHNVDLHKEVQSKKSEAVARDKVVVATQNSQGLDFNAYQRQKEMTKREAKKKMLVSFVQENEVNFDYIKNAFQQYLDVPLEERIGGRVKFDEFCTALSVEPIAEYRRMHALFDAEEKGDVDFREVLLSMMNFVEVDKEMRVRFSFTMFDEAKSGFISHTEVEEILRGNHMISLSSVQRKADTIMRQAKSNANGSITMNEFVVVSKKFPNILLPSLGSTTNKK